MALVNPLPYIDKVKEEKEAIGAFNVYNLETIRAVVESAEDLKAPVILQITPGTLNYARLDYISHLIKIAAANSSIPIALHLDHCTSYNTIVKAIQHGFTSVMIDGSRKPYQENVALVKEVVKVAHAAGVAVEAEIGKISGVEDDFIGQVEAALTKPEEAEEFVDKTNVDLLAVAIGTAHGVYQGEPKLDFERLQKIATKIDVPLVLHGASGVSESAIEKAVELGICKVNIATDLKIPFTENIKNFLSENPAEYDLRRYLGAGLNAIKEVVKRKIKLLKSDGLGK